MTEIAIPEFSLVVLVGPSGAGKSTFARRHFLETEIISSDRCRALVADDEADQAATADAFDLVYHTAGLRLKNRRIAVIDSTAAHPEDRKRLVALGRKWHAPIVALVLDIDPDLCHERNAERPERDFGPQVSRNQSRSIRRGLRGIKREGFASYHIMRSPAEADALEIRRDPLWTDQRTETGPFDIIGDVHGCFDELTNLLESLGYDVDGYTQGEHLLSARHPEGRRAVFVGDLCDRGPRNVDVLRLAMGMIREGTGAAVIGNHDFKLLRWLRGRNVTVSHGLDLTVSELEQTSDEFRTRVRDFIGDLRSHSWLDEGRLVVAHAGLKEEMHGRGSGAVRQFAMFGDTTGEVDEFGLPVRLEWARNYRGSAAVVYGHTPTLAADWLNGTICIDTGCVFGGKLTALRWPEKELVSVDATQEYAVPAKPLDHKAGIGKDQLIYFDELLGRRRIETRYRTTIIVPEGHTTAALEVMSRFAIDPRWLIHLPPTMAPCPTAPEGPYLEYPDQALDYYREAGVGSIIAEEKHMGSRALIIVCRDAEAAARRFRVEDGKAGIIYTRTGRAFFRDDAIEEAIVDRIARAITASNLWEELPAILILAFRLLEYGFLSHFSECSDWLSCHGGPVARGTRSLMRVRMSAAHVGKMM